MAFESFYLVKKTALKEAINKYSTIYKNDNSPTNNLAIICHFIDKELGVLSNDNFSPEIKFSGEEKCLTFQYMAHLEGVDGVVSTSSLKNNDSDVVGFTGWAQGQFLYLHLAFLIKLYLEITKKYINNDSLIADEKKKKDLLAILFNEVWIAANAYGIIKILQFIQYKTEAEKKEYCCTLARVLVNSLIKTIAQEEAVQLDYFQCGDEICLPIGLFNHSIYLSIYKNSDKNLTFRIDDFGAGWSYAKQQKIDSKIIPLHSDEVPSFELTELSFDVISQNRESLISYFSDIFVFFKTFIQTQNEINTYIIPC